MLRPDPGGAACLWVHRMSQPTFHPVPSVGSESDTQARKRGGLAPSTRGRAGIRFTPENQRGAGDPE